LVAGRGQDPVNIEASELVGALHDALEKSKYTGHDLERFLVRLVFCFFADVTGIFEPARILLTFLENRTKEDGSDTGALLSQLFEVLNTDKPDRQSNLDEELAEFEYVNPPFSGSKHQDAEKRAQSQRIADLGGSAGTLDYVASWFLKAGA
jgi:hypothetical protein